ncbi:hypothetical protein TNCV_1740661 [Trichonephila clavipes]|uniref:Uncharacterized protein n=1 Tax=Trichonephila clavipes TaxID=2585209 RepID=A0A8X6UTN1_TRICX|nr:hypothetical protein TNCV_1740661 [Trichonephila clavipes]
MNADPSNWKVRSIVHFLNTWNIMPIEIHHRFVETYGKNETRDEKVKNSFVNPTPLAHDDTPRDILPREGISQLFVHSFGLHPKTAAAGSDVVQSGRPIFDDFFQHLWPYIGNNTANVVFQMVTRLWLIRIDQ